MYTHTNAFIAIGKTKVEINKLVDQFDVSIPGPEHIYMTKAQVMEKGRKEYEEFTRYVNAYKTDPIAALEQFGSNAKAYYDIRETTIVCKEPDFEKYYIMFIRDYLFSDSLDKDGNILSCCSPNGKWESCGVIAAGTLKDIYAKAEEHRSKYTPECDIKIWNAVVEHKRNDFSDKEYIEILSNNPSREHMLARYETMEKFIKARRRAFAHTWAIITPDVKWHQRYDDGFYAHYSERISGFMQWEEEYCDKILKAYPDDTLYSMFDYNI